MITIDKKEWDKIPNDYKGCWNKYTVEFRGDLPTYYIGKRNVLGGCISDDQGSLLTEGIHFIIK